MRAVSFIVALLACVGCSPTPTHVDNTLPRSATRSEAPVSASATDALKDAGAAAPPRAAPCPSKEGARPAAATIDSLVTFLNRIPGVCVTFADAVRASWQVSLTIDITHPLAWNVVQELGHILNDFSLTETLPTVFFPVSPPPYLNGGPKEYLSWRIVSQGAGLDPDEIAKVLEGYLPRPVEDFAKWPTDEE